MKFTLYQTLDANIPKRDLTIAQKNKIINIIDNVLDEQGLELLYALIKHYNMNVDKANNELYNCEITKKQNDICDVEWNLTNLPIHLRQIIYKFICLEEKRLEEAVERRGAQVKMKINITPQKD